MSENLYVSFRRDEAGRACFFNTFGTSVEDFMGRVNGFYGDWGSSRAGVIAWSPIHSSTHTVEEDCAAALAAGRVIEYVNGKYFARGIEDPELVALQTRPQHVEASCEEEPKYTAEQLAWILHGKRPASKTPTLDKLESGTDLDGKRAPLPYFTEQQERAKFDPFSDFIVHHREEASVNVKPFAGLQLDAPEQFRAPRSI